MTKACQFGPQFIVLVVTVVMTSCNAFHDASSPSTVTPLEHQFVSADGGFVMETDFKTPVSQIEQSFELYRFLRGDPKMTLYRTTPARAEDGTSGAASHPYSPDIRRAPTDWMAELRDKSRREYIPTLPTVYEDDHVRLFFFNQYSRKSVVIHGELNGMLFSLFRDIEPETNRFGTTYDFFVWDYCPEIDIEKPEWQNVWHLVNGMQNVILSRWQSEAVKLMKQFEPNYDNLF